MVDSCSMRVLRNPDLAGEAIGDRTWATHLGGDCADSRHCTLSAGGMWAIPMGDDARLRLWAELCSDCKPSPSAIKNQSNHKGDIRT